jgi:hypothetical protein
LSTSVLTAPALAQQRAFVPGTLVVSRVHYNGDTNRARGSESFPLIFNDPNLSGIQGSIFLDSFLLGPFSPRVGRPPPMAPSPPASARNRKAHFTSRWMVMC